MEIIPHYIFKEFEENYLQEYVIHLSEDAEKITLLDYYEKLDDYYSGLVRVLGDLFNDQLIDIIKNNFHWEVFRGFVFVKFPDLFESQIDGTLEKATIRYSFEMNRLIENRLDIGVSLYMELNNILSFLTNKIIEAALNRPENNNDEKRKRVVLTNPKKLALLQAIGFFDLPTITELSEDDQNKIVALLLDADKKEFVYKNRLNLNSKNPNYQIDKYTAFQYVEEMEQLLNGMQ
ncbi:hypothetical protein DRF60_14430 [Chryseobacterium elymi]|uniref:Uncharacterized protein n=1 Tax=Chryseobacterium elymi TaxID=395936 RepID=A0A3D9DDH4_9FLAO|nr:hypothetical protein [Chryseobacterium elymi]REC76077.1 hypothetical protein DRF60_14430 [Chryseobacterium elymi]